MKRMVVSFLFLFFISGQAMAAPSISSVTGTFNDGQSIVVRGSLFGSDVDVSKIHYLKPNIEGTGINDPPGGTPLFSDKYALPGWFSSTDGATGYAPKYSTIQRHSKTKSIYCKFIDDFLGSNQYACGYGYDNGSTFANAFVSAWIDFDPHQTSLITGSQYKIMSFSDKAYLGSSEQSCAIHSWHDFSGKQCGGVTPCWYNNSAAFSYNVVAGSGVISGISAPAYRPPYHSFVRWDTYGQKSSGPGVADATYRTDVYNTDGPHRMYQGRGISYTDINKWRYINLGGYFGDFNRGSGERRNLEVWEDDIYISIDNGQARVELCDASTWSSRKHCEIQYPMSWSNGSISIMLNRGSFNAGNTAYLYVVDAQGNVSNSGQGYSITLGSNIQGASNPAPAPPKNLHIVN